LGRQRAEAVLKDLQLLSFAYLVTDRADLKERYSQSLNAVISRVTDWTHEQSNFHRNDENAMRMMAALARSYTWGFDAISVANKGKMVSQAAARASEVYWTLTERTPFLWRTIENDHSGRSWHYLAEVATAFHGDFPETRTWLDFIFQTFYNVYPSWADESGGWHEGLIYWKAYLSLFRDFVPTLRNVYKINIFKNPYFHKIGNMALYTLPMSHQTPKLNLNAGKSKRTSAFDTL